MRRAPHLARLSLLLAAAVFLWPRPVAADPGDNSFALRAARIYPGTTGAPVLENQAIIVRNGKIAELCDADKLPDAAPDLPWLDYRDAVVTPGFVAAATDDGERHRGDESVAAGYRAIDAYDRYGDFATTLAGGVTTVHLHPGSHRLLTGQGAVVKLAGRPHERVLSAQSDLVVNLGEAANAPPRDETYSFPASSDVAIPVPKLQRPSSRLGQLLAIEESVRAALAGKRGKYFSRHPAALAAAWNAKRTLRIHADRAVDIVAAVEFLKRQERHGYIVGAAEAHRVARALKESGVRVVRRSRRAFLSRVTSNVGLDPDSLSTDFRDLDKLKHVGLALGVPVGHRTRDLRLAAALAHGAGLAEEWALAAITRMPAEILGVHDRVGSLAPGMDADLVVLSSAPLAIDSHVLRVFVNGRTVYESGVPHSLVVRAGTIWTGAGPPIKSGEALIQDGKFAAVGRSVPHPPGARVIDGGPDAFMTPGFIDSRGHLGLLGDRGSASAGLDLTRIVGVPGELEHRVARAGITTVLVSPYSIASTGSRFTAVKTAGRTRQKRIVKDVAAIAFDVSRNDPLLAEDGIRRVLARGKKYVAKWRAYEKALKEYMEKKKRGEPVGKKRKLEVEEKEKVEDPITGVWLGTVSGGPIPEPETGKVALRLEENRVEGRVIDPPVPVDHKIVLTLDGKKLTGHIEVDTGGQGYPTVEAEIVAPDKTEGTISFMGISVNFEAERIEKGEVEFKVTRRTVSSDGRPEPPPVDPALEPIKALLEKRIPAVVNVTAPAAIRELLKMFIDDEKLPLVLLNAPGAEHHVQRLKEGKVGVVLARDFVKRRKDKEYHQGDHLARSGVTIGFQSQAEDGAHDLPYHVLFAVERGLSGEAALRALTSGAARMFKIDDRVGTIAAGKDADFNIFRGHPFRTASPAARVFVNGEEVQP